MKDKDKCSTCGNEFDGEMDIWPGDNGDICLSCWEKECAASWWKRAAPHWKVPPTEEKGERENMKKIFYESPEAARYVTGIAGWVDSGNRFFGDNPQSEDMARYSGCTHRICGCGNEMEKHYTACAECREKAAAERHENRERMAWDESRPVYSEAADQYFYSWEEIEDFLFEDRRDVDSLRLLICEPAYLSEIDDDYWDDDLPEDGRLPETVAAALDNLNATLRRAGAVSWEPGKFAVDLEGEE